MSRKTWQKLPDTNYIEVGKESSEGGWFIRIVLGEQFCSLFHYQDGGTEYLMGNFDNFDEALDATKNIT